MVTDRNFYLQRMGVDGDGNEYPVRESVSAFQIWCKDIPFKVADKVKAPAKRSWNDEHGDDEYISETDGLFMEAYTMKVEFGCKAENAYNPDESIACTAEDIIKGHVKDFLDYLRKGGMMKMYSDYTCTGRKYVRLDSVSDNATWKQGDDGWWFLLFEATFKVNDPVTEIKKRVDKDTVILYE